MNASRLLTDHGRCAAAFASAQTRLLMALRDLAAMLEDLPRWCRESHWCFPRISVRTPAFASSGGI